MEFHAWNRHGTDVTPCPAGCWPGRLMSWARCPHCATSDPEWIDVGEGAQILFWIGQSPEVPPMVDLLFMVSVDGFAPECLAPQPLRSAEALAVTHPIEASTPLWVSCRICDADRWTSCDRTFRRGIRGFLHRKRWSDFSRLRRAAWAFLAQENALRGDRGIVRGTGSLGWWEAPCGYCGASEGEACYWTFWEDTHPNRLRGRVPREWAHVSRALGAYDLDPPERSADVGDQRLRRLMLRSGFWRD